MNADFVSEDEELDEDAFVVKPYGKARLSKLVEILQSGDQKKIESVMHEITEHLEHYEKQWDLLRKVSDQKYQELLTLQQELRTRKSYDWDEKWRTLLFRLFWSILFILTIFAIGWLDKQDGWDLPLSSYFDVGKQISPK